jgi:hypothetical protein
VNVDDAMTMQHTVSDNGQTNFMTTTALARPAQQADMNSEG